jgi:hypothetical protein
MDTEHVLKKKTLKTTLSLWLQACPTLQTYPSFSLSLTPLGNLIYSKKKNRPLCSHKTAAVKDYKLEITQRVCLEESKP